MAGTTGLEPATSAVLRDLATLPSLRELKRPVSKLLLDATVYIDELQGRLPIQIEISLRLTEACLRQPTRGSIRNVDLLWLSTGCCAIVLSGDM